MLVKHTQVSDLKSYHWRAYQLNFTLFSSLWLLDVATAEVAQQSVFVGANNPAFWTPIVRLL